VDVIVIVIVDVIAAVIVAVHVNGTAPVIVHVIVIVAVVVIVIVDVISGASAGGAHGLVNLHVSNSQLFPRHHLQLHAPARAHLEKGLHRDIAAAAPAARAARDAFDLQRGALQDRAARTDVETEAQRLLRHAREVADLQPNDVDSRGLHALFDGGHDALDQGQLVHRGAM